MPKISVVVPVYNVEEYLKECLDSILNQTFDDFEVICVDDGSTDSSLDILHSYSSDKIMIFSQKNKGVGAARNLALDHACGDYVLFVDSDDYIEPTTLEELYANAVSNGSDMVLFRYTYFRPDSEELKGYSFDFGDVDYNSFTFDYTHAKKDVMNTFLAVWMNFYRKEFLDRFEDSRFQEDTVFEDVLFHVKTFLRAEKISFVPKAFYHYRYNPKSIVHTPKNCLDIFLVCDSVEDFLKSNGYIEEFKKEFILFKILKISLYLFLSDSEEYFQKAKEEYSKIDLSSQGTLPENKQLVYESVLKSDTYSEFLKNYYRTRMSILSSEISKLKSTNKKLAGNLEELEAANQDLTDEYNELKARNHELESKIDELNSKYDSIINSKSWKMTEPLRDFSDSFKQQ